MAKLISKSVPSSRVIRLPNGNLGIPDVVCWCVRCGNKYLLSYRAYESGLFYCNCQASIVFRRKEMETHPWKPTPEKAARIPQPGSRTILVKLTGEQIASVRQWWIDEISIESIARKLKISPYKFRPFIKALELPDRNIQRKPQRENGIAIPQNRLLRTAAQEYDYTQRYGKH